IKDNIVTINKRFIHMEVCNLIIPKIGDSVEKCRELAEFLVDLNPNIPLHLLQFYPDESFPDLEATPLSTLERCAEEAIRAGLRYVYLSNVPENRFLNTYCYNCQETLIKRTLFETLENVVKENRCPFCGFKIKLIV
ncbi:MAG: AmmeMemoRadiSam system radical SAM enzyme, partial [Candidatus Aenigmarchaeota archaeon]|nr:AmmeMemoRadiSam system radical SAM enzyme [Candidatus Aenigmarchaeota archaeon]MDW8148976.1 AmmeMemoRadiSam system radical SAM enzyme [Candidatus Aenigmarchaeota archaeon]